MRVRSIATLLLLSLATSGTSAAQDKAGYTLFAPTPDRLLRDMTTDRPDTTESPFTIDAGRIQLESNLVGYARSHHDGEGTLTESFEFATTNMRFGLNAWSEVAVVWQPYAMITTHPRAPASSVSQSGIGALDLRMKVNLWGNDAFDKPGATALALLPYISLPTDRDNGISPERAEGGLIVPLAIKLSDKFSLGANVGAVRLHDAEASGYQTEYLASASLSYEWSSKLGSYYEVAVRMPQSGADETAIVLGTGLTYKLTGNLQLDGGVNVGATKAADALNPFIGISARF